MSTPSPPGATGPDDATLVAAAQRGDRSSMDALLRRHYDRIYAVCRRVTGHDADAADAAQEALILVVRNLAKFDGRSSFGTWVYRIATNASLDEMRRRRRRPITGIGSSTHEDEHAPTEPVDPDAGAHIDAIPDRMLLDHALANLAPEFRVPVVLRDVGALDYAEISEIVGVPVGTVKSRIARGRAQLANALGPKLNADGNQAPESRRPRPAPSAAPITPPPPAP